MLRPFSSEEAYLRLKPGSHVIYDGPIKTAAKARVVEVFMDMGDSWSVTLSGGHTFNDRHALESLRLPDGSLCGVDTDAPPVLKQTRARVIGQLWDRYRAKTRPGEWTVNQFLDWLDEQDDS